MQLLDEVQGAWGWTGIEPVELIDHNEFGNLLLRDLRGQYWRICPEDLYCEVIAVSKDELNQVWNDQKFLSGWTMRELVDQAFQRFGPLPPGRKYCFKIPGVLGGTYGGDNLATISLDELIRSSGDIAQQIAGLPDGTSFELAVTG